MAKSMYQKREERKNKSEEKSCLSVNINCYPRPLCELPLYFQYFKGEDKQCLKI